MRDSFIFYKSFYEAIKELTTEQQATVVLAIMQYQFDETEPVLEGVPKAIFTLIKPQLDANNTRYENGCKGGAPKGNSNAKKQPKNKQETTEKQANENVNENDNVNDNENEKKKKKESKKEKPNYEEVLKKFSLSEEVENAVRDFIQMRSFIKHPLTNRGLELAIKEVLRLSSQEEEQVKIFEQSVMRNWLGVFPLKKETQAKIDPLKEIMKEEGYET